jgi:transcriptional regulator with XRE-family HTH domain
MGQKELAEKLEIDRSYLNGILRGKRIPSRKLAKRIAALTGRHWLEFRKQDKELLRELL